MEKNQEDTTVPKKSNTKYKLIAIFTGVILLIICCCIISFIAGTRLFSGILETGEEVKTELLSSVCKDYSTMSMSDYNNWFTSSFRSTNSQQEAKELLDDVFPAGYNCDDMFVGNIIELISKGQGVNVTYTPGNTTVVMTFRFKDGEQITFQVVEIDGDWKINSISKSIY